MFRTLYIAASRGNDYLGRIYKSENGGVSFSEVLIAENQSGASYDFNVIILDPTDQEHLFAGGGDFKRPKVPGDLWESQDGGNNWSLTGLRNKIVNAILVDPRNPEIMYAGCGHSTFAQVPLYKSTDGGITWWASFAGIPGPEPSFPHYDGDTPSVMRKSGTSNRAVTDLEFHRKNKKVIYASTYGAGVYSSPNQARDWLNLGTPEHNVHAISISSSIAGTTGAMYTAGFGFIIGLVKDATDGNGINDAKVSNNTLSIDKYTHNGGGYSMISCPGNFTLEASAIGYNNQSKGGVIVSGGDITRYDFDLTPSP